MKLQKGSIDGNIPDNDNLCIKCFIEKYTINLAIDNEISDHVGSVEVIMRPMFGAFGKAGSANSIAFVSKKIDLIYDRQAAMDCNIKTFYGLNKKVAIVKNVRKLTKLDMKLNDALPNIEVDPET
ncbi:urease isoform X1 [Tanacetum coccineum]